MDKMGKKADNFNENGENLVKNILVWIKSGILPALAANRRKPEKTTIINELQLLKTWRCIFARTVQYRIQIFLAFDMS